MSADLSPIKVWIAGASGFCGRALTRELAQDERFVVSPHLRPSSRRLERLSEEWERLGLRPVIAEWAELEAPFQALQPDVVVSLIGTTKRQAKRGGGSYGEVDEGLNLKLIELSRGLSSPAQLIYLSSQGVEWGRWSAYLGARMRVEAALHSSGLSGAILRPGLLSGESRDEARPLEELGARVSHTLVRLCELLKLQRLALSFKPLDAPELALIIKRTLLELRQLKVNQDFIKTYELTELHERLLEARIGADLLPSSS